MIDRTKDIDGRPYAKVADVKIGDKLIADGGFTCIEAGAVLHVNSDDAGLFVNCTDGSHHLDGQEEDGVYIGLCPADTEL